MTARTSNSKEPQQKHGPGTASTKTPGAQTGPTGTQPQPQPQSLSLPKTYSCSVRVKVLFGKELFIRFTASAFRKLPSIYVFSYFPFGFEGRMWDLIVSVPDHCLSFYMFKLINGSLRETNKPQINILMKQR